MSTTRMGKGIECACPGIFQLNSNRFNHMITQEKRSVKPRECRGGILADEMGMVFTPSIGQYINRDSVKH